MHRTAAAFATYTKAISISEGLLVLDPKKMETTGDLARMYSGVGGLFLKEGNREKAYPALKKANGLFQAAIKRDPSDTALRKDGAECEKRLTKSSEAR